MMSTINVDNYFVKRSEGLPARYAFSLAKHNQYAIPGEFDNLQISFSYSDVTWITKETFDIGFQREYDDAYYQEVAEAYGYFTEQYRKGAISHEPDNPRSYNWFVPAMSEQEYYTWFHDEQGYSKQVAREKARKEVLELYLKAKTYNDTWVADKIVIKVCKKGILLYTHTIWGVLAEDEQDKDYFYPLIVDATNEAIAEAQERLRELCHCNELH